MIPTDPRPASPKSVDAPDADVSKSSESASGCGGAYTARDWKNQRRFTGWMLAMAIAYISSSAAIRWRRSNPEALGWLPELLVALTVLLALQATRSYLSFLRRADELLRRIEVEALALGFGSGAVFSLLYPLLEKIGAPRIGGHITFVIMMFAWAAGSWLGARRYAGSGAP